MKYLGVASHGDRSTHRGYNGMFLGWWGFRWLQHLKLKAFAFLQNGWEEIVYSDVDSWEVFSIIPFPHVVSFLICIISALVYDSCMWLFLSTCVWLGLHIPAWNSREVAPDTGAKSRTRLGVGKLRLFWSPNIFVERQDGYIICQVFRPWNVNGQIELGHECV